MDEMGWIVKGVLRKHHTGRVLSRVQLNPLVPSCNMKEAVIFINVIDYPAREPRLYEPFTKGGVASKRINKSHTHVARFRDQTSSKRTPAAEISLLPLAQDHPELRTYSVPSLCLGLQYDSWASTRISLMPRLPASRHQQPKSRHFLTFSGSPGAPHVQCCWPSGGHTKRVVGPTIT
jgi:hypothetical protein